MSTRSVARMDAVRVATSADVHIGLEGDNLELVRRSTL
jgi:hypothetical protein